MSDVALSATVDLRQVEAGLDAMGNPQVVAKALRAVRKPLRDDQRDHAKRNEGPGGKWPARTLKSRKRLLGRLPTAVKVTSTSTSVSAVSSVPWSSVHQEGGIVGRGARIPARPFLWASESLKTRAAEILRDAVKGEW